MHRKCLERFAGRPLRADDAVFASDYIRPERPLVQNTLYRLYTGGGNSHPLLVGPRDASEGGFTPYSIRDAVTQICTEQAARSSGPRPTTSLRTSSPSC